MTSTFDVISEAKIQTEDFGEDAPINVGLGSKQTHKLRCRSSSALRRSRQSRCHSLRTCMASCSSTSFRTCQYRHTSSNLSSHLVSRHKRRRADTLNVQLT